MVKMVGPHRACFVCHQDLVGFLEGNAIPRVMAYTVCKSLSVVLMANTGTGYRWMVLAIAYLPLVPMSRHRDVGPPALPT